MTSTISKKTISANESSPISHVQPNPIRRPRLVFFQFRYPQNAASFQLIHKDEHVRCFAQFFEVAVIAKDCEYQEVLDRYEPELVVFETGLEAHHVRKPRVRSVALNSQVPKVAFLNADGCSELRPAIISDIEEWGIDTLFSISLAAADHLPGLASNIFVLPNFIDPRIFHDYHLPKTNQVVLTGSLSTRYPWRRQVYDVLASHYPTVVVKHPGYAGKGAAGTTMVGEPYARLLNASMFSPACGSVSNELVRKHLEIPGSMACLIAEKSPAVVMAGFQDMVNCIFANDNDVVEKVGFLIANPDKLAEMTENGYRLVHSKHTMAHRDQLFQWFNLMKNRSPREVIRQAEPFGPLTADRDIAPHFPSQYDTEGMHLQYFRRGERLFEEANYQEASRMYAECLALLCEFPEAKFKIALCHLYTGSPELALQQLLDPLRTSLVRYGARTPDPVEWAYVILALVCMGNVGKAKTQASRFPELYHTELQRARWVASALAHRAFVQGSLIVDPYPVRSRSIHSLRDMGLEEWIGRFCKLLELCDQGRRAVTLRNIYANGCRREPLDRNANVGAQLTPENGPLCQPFVLSQKILSSVDLFMPSFVKCRHRLLLLRLRCSAAGVLSCLFKCLETKFGIVFHSEKENGILRSWGTPPR